VIYLVDGYNLMHAVGLAGRKLPGSLDRARTRFLDWLADASKDRDAAVWVAFDAATASRRSPEADHRGVRVLFATGRTADELIEQLVNAELRPERLTVVSNDAQVQESARRRGCGVRTCEGFVDWLIGGEAPPVAPAPAPPATDKPGPDATPAEMAAWLAAFSAAPEKGQRRPRLGRR
jgi:predicted RNA-binding protein with PIN domain